MSTATVTPPQQDWFAANAPPPASSAASGDWFEQNAPKAAPPDNRSWLDKTMSQPNPYPLDSAKNVVNHLLFEMGRGFDQGVVGAAKLVNPTKNAGEQHWYETMPAYRIGKGIADTFKSSAQVPGAVKDIAQDAAVNPSGTSKALTEGFVDTAGQATGQLGSGKVMESAIQNAPAAIDAIRETPSAVKSAAQSPTGQVITAAAKKIPAAAIRRIPYVGDVAADVYNAAKNARPLDATKENVPFAGEEEPPVSASPQPAAAQPATPAPDTSRANVERLLNDATGAKPLQPNVPLRAQATSVAKPSSLPPDFTPVKSSALKGYKYDPDAQEFTSITNNGQTYVHSGVTPDMMAAFEGANSKGTAWNILRKSPGVDLVAKNGKSLIKTSYRSASPDDVAPGEEATPAASPKTSSPQSQSSPAAQKSAPASSSGEDLTSLLQESLKNAQRLKSGVEHTMQDPAKLTEQWGVDEESLANTREQTRGMTPEQTEQYTQKLADSYKKGVPVEPLLETRDQYGNILEVDGRQRAIAAQRAGVKQVPVIRRYIKMQ